MARSPADVFKEAIRRAVTDLFPELGRGTHVTIRAKVVKVDAVAAGKSTRRKYGYSATVMPLTRKGKLGKLTIPDVPIDKIWGGAGGRGIYALPSVGTIVRLGFDYGDPALPYIAGVLTEDQDMPAAGIGELVIQQGANTWVKIKADGSIVLESSAGIFIGDGATEPIPLGTALLDWLNSHVHLGNLGGPTSAATVAGLPLTLLSGKHKVK